MNERSGDKHDEGATPRTEAQAKGWNPIDREFSYVPMDFARQLERELAEANRLRGTPIELQERAENAEAQLARILHLQEQVVGRVMHGTDGEVVAALNSVGRELPDNTPLYTHPRSHTEQQDGVRYRWLNRQDNFMIYIDTFPEMKRNHCLKCGEVLDKWIDARIEEEDARSTPAPKELPNSVPFVLGLAAEAEAALSSTATQERWKVVHDGPSLPVLQAPNGRIYRIQELGAGGKQWGNPENDELLCRTFADCLTSPVSARATKVGE